MMELMLWDEILRFAYSLVHKHNYMNNEPCVSGINPHFLHTEELARCRSENFLFSGVVYVLFWFLGPDYAGPRFSASENYPVIFEY